MIEAIGKFILTPICGALAFWVFFHYLFKD
jgi:hypothetical protein